MKLTRLGFDDYADYLRSDHWRETRRAYWESDQPKECICGETERLQLHHLTYERLGYERLSDLTPLCKRCHSAVHVLVNRGDLGLDFAGFVNARRAERYARQRSDHDDPDFQMRQWKKEARSRGERWKAAYLEAWKKGVDMEPHRDLIDTVIEDMRAAA